MREKTAVFGCRKKVRYSGDQWKLLEEKRAIAANIMKTLADHGIDSVVYGSVARGDVKKTSDVDIFVPSTVPSYRIELALHDCTVLEKKIVQATPNYAIKGEIVLENANISFPLVKMRDKELDFYKFGGCMNLDSLMKKNRVAGVDKRLVLIIPLKDGHYEIPANELDVSELADFLGVGVEIVNERFRVLERRREIGRTGVFLSEIVHDFESFETKLKEIVDRNPLVKRRLVL